MLTWVRDQVDEDAVERIMRDTLGSWARRATPATSTSTSTSASR